MSSFIVIMVTTHNMLRVSRYRKGGQRAIDELQRTISEIEAKYKAELGRQRKKFETDIREYEIQVETLNRANAELGKNSKAATSRIKVWNTRFADFLSSLKNDIFCSKTCLKMIECTNGVTAAFGGSGFVRVVSH